MDCREAREHLPELDASHLPAAVEQEVRSHLAGCADCRELAEADARLRALLRAHAQRFQAPPALRRRLAEMVEGAAASRRSWRDRLGWRVVLPALAGVAAALLVFWGGSRWLTGDPVSPLLAQAVQEHAEYAKEAMPRPAPDPPGLLRSLSARVGFPVEPVFSGDAQVELVSAASSEIRGHRAAALVYRSAGGIYSTLFLLSDDVPIPAESRMAIQTYQPHHRVADGRHLLLWKQRGLTHLLVTDLAEPQVPAMFLKIRTVG